jgi:hypothetical protein
LVDTGGAGAEAEPPPQAAIRSVARIRLMRKMHFML